MHNDGSIGKRLGRAFLVQALIISIAALLSVYAAALTIEQLLVRQALRQEAEYFWQQRERQPDFPLPDTQNMTGYLEHDGRTEGIPGSLSGLGTGFHRLAGDGGLSVAYVTRTANMQLVLVFDGNRVRELAVFFGVVPLAFVLIIIYLTSWLGYRLSSRAVSPIVHMSYRVNELDLEAPDPTVFDVSRLPGKADKEIVALADALGQLSKRLNEFVERERNFTRDASHELRSPLTVVKIATNNLLSDESLDKTARNNILRIQRSAKDMEELTEAFLLLARASEVGLAEEDVSVNDVVDDELQRARLILGDESLRIEIDAPEELVVQASEKVLSVLIGNLIRNALNYTDEGEILISIRDRLLTIEDSGKGMPEGQVEELFKPFVRGERRRGGYGVGLTIVKRLSDHFGWPVTIDSRPGHGTKVSVDFSGR
jgi:signal transduction histidine kinase